MQAARMSSARLVSGLLGCLVAIASMAGLTPVAAAQLLGSVSGTVRSAGAPVANAWVTLMPVTAAGAWAGRPARTATDRDGRYAFSDLATAHVKVQVRAPSFSGLVSTYWPDAYSFAAAGTLEVTASGATADVDLAVGGAITGSVVDADTGAPIPGAQVAAHVDAAPGWEPVGSPGLAAGPGIFVIDGLPPLPVALQVRAAAGSNHLSQWFDGAGFQGEADQVAPGTSGLVIRLREGGQVGGVVRDDRGAPVPGAQVTLVGCPALCPMVARADDAGAYRINGVPPGPGLRAHAQGPESGLLSGWYAAPGESGDTSFDLAAGEERSDLDFVLTQGAVIVGRILDAQTGQPIPGVSVDLVDVGNPLHSHLSREVAEPPASEFVIGPVPPGEYALTVYPGRENGDFLPVQVVASTGLDGPGRLDLARGEHAELSLRLARQRTSTPEGTQPGGITQGAGRDDGSTATVGSAAGRSDPNVSAGWPGLSRGFLAADGLGLGGLVA